MPDLPSAVDIALRAGIDLALTDDNLRLSFDRRALQHQAALDLAQDIERAGQRLRERSASTPASQKLLAASSATITNASGAVVIRMASAVSRSRSAHASFRWSMLMTQ